MVHCGKCGSTNDLKSAEFCPACGASLVTPSAPAADLVAAPPSYVDAIGETTKEPLLDSRSGSRSQSSRQQAAAGSNSIDIGYGMMYGNAGDYSGAGDEEIVQRAQEYMIWYKYKTAMVIARIMLLVYWPLEVIIAAMAYFLYDQSQGALGALLANIVWWSLAEVVMWTQIRKRNYARLPWLVIFAFLGWPITSWSVLATSAVSNASVPGLAIVHVFLGFFGFPLAGGAASASKTTYQMERKGQHVWDVTASWTHVSRRRFDDSSMYARRGVAMLQEKYLGELQYHPATDGFAIHEVPDSTPAGDFAV